VIGKLVLKFGSGTLGSTLEFEPGPVTVFVGPNNSGKSLLLREIETYTSMGGEGDFKAVDWIEPEIPESEEVERLLLSRRFDSPDLDSYYGRVTPGYTRIGKVDLTADPDTGRLTVQAWHVNLEYVRSSLRTAEDTPVVLREDVNARKTVFGSFVSLFTVRLDGGARLNLTRQRPSGDLQDRARNHLWSLAKDDDARVRLRHITQDAFGRYFLLDPTGMQFFRVRMSETEPPPGVELSLATGSREFLKQATDIADLSDGIKAFTGLAAAVLSADYRVMLIDEPEAFLHPVLAKKLGRRLTEIASERGGNVLAATHSPDFLMGCVETGTVNVVRLTFQNGKATARHLPSDQLRQMMRESLLRSTGVLGGLFHEGVVVCEADTDRAIYQEVNQRLSMSERSAAKNTLFMNAHEKSTVRRIVEPLRGMGIPAAAVVDLDIIKNRDFNDLLKTAHVPNALIESWNTLRSRTKDKFEEMGLDMKESGIQALPEAEREAAQTLLDGIAEYGVFVVPRGELEQWFSQLHGRSDRPTKSRWVPWVLDLMNTDPGLFGVTDDDVWGFVSKIADWISDPERKGIPT
jgi:ABC-type multidrug transport system ATPase subunit